MAPHVSCPIPGRRTWCWKANMSGLMTLSARNRLQGKITELQLGGVMAHVVIQVGNDFIESVITRRSAVEMNLKVGDTVSAVIKSTEIMIEKQ
jgi:molybdopterin-binding protein